MSEFLGLNNAFGFGMSNSRYNPAASTPVVSPIQEAWEIVMHYDKVADPRRLNELFITFGIIGPESLHNRNPNEIQAIAMTLKSIPRRRFLQLFGLPGF